MPGNQGTRFVVISLFAFLASIAGAAEAPKFTGDSLPTPPQQKSEWKPPADAKLPEKFISATRVLFEQGMADPRGLEYRNVEVVIGDVWGGQGASVKTHAWIIPTDKTAKADVARFVAAWNGLVYPAISVGDPADLKADVAAMCDADEKMRAEQEKANGKGSFYRFRNAVPESQSLDYKTLTATRACMLLRLGEGALSKRAWDDWTSGMKQDTNDDAAHLRDPYLMLATEWVWARFDRAVCAHMRGDDRLVQVDARALIDMEVQVNAEARKRGFDDPDAAQKRESFVDFLSAVPLLRDDADRRLKQPARASALSAGPKKFKTKAEYIAALIADLDQVAAPQMGQPGGVDLGGDPIVVELIKQGDDAVEPLIHCFETDIRLTRSVHFWRDFARYRSLLGVHEAAYVAICGILKESFFGVAATGDDLSARGLEGRRAVAEKIREHWKKFKGISLPERWYMTLSDDKAAPNQWSQAAANIAEPGDVEVTPSSMIGGWRTEPVRKPGEKPKLQGNPLRQKKNPSVSELLVKRMQAMMSAATADAASSNAFTSWSAAAEIAAALADWDAKSNLDALRDYTLAMQKQNLANPFGNGYWFVMRIAAMFEKRQAAGDRRVIEDYVSWLKSIPRDKVDGGASPMFQLMWQNPNDPAIAAPARTCARRRGPTR
jgi:hypothetical protein